MEGGRQEGGKEGGKERGREGGRKENREGWNDSIFAGKRAQYLPSQRNNGSERPEEEKIEAYPKMCKIYVSGWWMAFPQGNLLPVIAII